MPLDADIYGYKEAITPSLVVSTALHAALLACLVFLPAVLSRSGEDWGNNGNGGASGEAISAHLVERNSLASQSPCQAGKRAGERKQGPVAIHPRARRKRRRASHRHSRQADAR